MMKSRFKVLRLISSIYKLLAVIVMVVAVVLAALTLVSAFFAPDLLSVSAIPASPIQDMIVQAVVLLVGGLLIAITLFAAGEAIHVVLSMEDNTAKTALLLRHLIRETTPPAEAEEL